MRFNDLEEIDKTYISETYLDKSLKWAARMSSLSERFGVTQRTIENWVSKLGLTTKHAPEPEQFKIAQAREHNKRSKRFIITWAQNNTPVHQDFLRNIEAYAEFINADIHVIAGRYKN
jgi:transposase-like protein